MSKKMAVISLFLGAGGGLGAWAVSNFLGGPILETQRVRSEALRVANRYAFVSSSSELDGVRAARSALADVASRLHSLWASGDVAVSHYCRLRRYNLRTAEFLLNGMLGFTGNDVHDQIRRDQLDALHVALEACSHLSGERIASLRQMMDNEPNLMH
jgi:hypothetical protein